MLNYLLIISFLKLILVQSENINMTMYYKMPPLYMYDNYDRCLKENPSTFSVYCLSVSQIIPKKNSELWNYIEEYNKDTMRHFRHDMFIYGHCVNWCNKTLNKLSIDEKEELYGGLLANKSLNNFFEQFYPEENGNRIRYNKIINQCINNNFKENYDLMVTSNIRYCDTNQDTITIDGYDIAFVIISLIILGLSGASTLYDLKLKLIRPPSQQNNSHYKEPIDDYNKSILVSFSICRNYFRLLRPSTLKYSRDIRFIDTFRFVMILGVVVNHLIQTVLVSGLENPEYVEKFLHRIDKIILTNSNGLMASFFLLSGFILYLTFTEMISKIQKENRYYTTIFFRTIILRYIRFTPLLAFVILFNSSILTKLYNGPIWRLATQRERYACQKNWWINLLYLQNYINTRDACLPQLWYLAVDFQVFIVCLIILLLGYKYPKLKNILIWTAVGLGCLIAALVCIIYNFNGVYIHRPEFFRHLYFFNSDFPKYYIPGHMNINGYVLGCWFGMQYLKLKENNSKIRENKFFHVSYYTFVIFGFAMIFSGEIYYQFNSVPVFVSAIFAAYYKFFYPFIIGILVVLMTQKIGWIGYEFCNLPQFRVLSRLSYAVLVMQYPILLTGASITRKTFYGNDFSIIVLGLGYVVLIYILAFFATLLIELPITALLKLLFERKQKTTLYKNGDINLSIKNSKLEYSEQNQLN